MLNFQFKKAVPVILQAEASECALACVAMVTSYYGFHTNLTELRKSFSISLKGVALDRVVSIVDQLGMSSRAVKADLDELPQLRLPAILHWNRNHFVVLTSISKAGAKIIDPAIGPIRLSISQVSEHYTGIALELTPGLDFRRKVAPGQIAIRPLIGRVVGLKRGVLQMAGLAIVMEIFALLPPMMTQWITDEALISGNAGLLSTLCIGMALIPIINATISAVRTWTAIYISTNFNMQWAANVMGHMLKLPIEYFERRHIGDIVSRFQAIKTIENTITHTSIDAILDGVLVVGMLAMMFVYNKNLTLVSLGAVLVYIVFRWIRYDAEKNAETGVVAKVAAEQSYFLESIRGVRSIKMLNRQRERRDGWVQHSVEALNARLILQKMSLLFMTCWAYISALEKALIFWLGASAVIEKSMSLGMLFAFISYKDQFTLRANNLINCFVEFKMLSVSTERLADIVLTEKEKEGGRCTVPEDLTLEIRNLSFRYAPGEPNVVNIEYLKIAPGECLAITGASGCGKTTLLKIMQGIIRPDIGDLTLGGVPVEKIGVESYRETFATVMQDDHLFAGSIYDNICFFDSSASVDWVEECAKAANIHDEIGKMTMGYHTLVGDMGTVLSGGQKQRILLARALFRKPKILFLDEATSHLDGDNENAICSAIAELGITRVMVAHRPQTISMANRVILLDKGSVIRDSHEVFERTSRNE
ncbi:peptidase domain-containing ABC transporter [Pseudoduganella chitinolytica]|uniref:Peptidase domain-containing ABC transporter n=1 Tax=Pseudoduganella chitinolytica TaxID=34070 RepID=A0ABY8BFJ9_9BURK|nr:peptidase domain-containing ABC transporter [Pseudoduganella chitinolytica]WEF34695.1 peptidase domain-containing ABC transporter [Pseudoduganella chitinolytica]